jgi:hypothetical protein|tara:strand:- start:1382 stop:1576 length:195 start_codon:yes stop_codon:yes gene_type:complete
MKIKYVGDETASIRYGDSLLKNGDVLDLPDEDARQLLKSERFEAVKKKAKKAAKAEETPSEGAE